MNEARNRSGQPRRSWIERISQVLQSEPQDREGLLEMLRDAQKRGLLDAEVLAMIEGAMQVSEMHVGDVMIPRPQMVVVDSNQSLEEILPVVMESAHSRFPFVGDNRDDVEGILLAKDLLPSLVSGGQPELDLRAILRPAVFIPESKRLNVLLRDFRASRNHMAIVVDEFGSVAGLVTIEDVLEQIVGEIDDEHDADEEFITRQGQKEYTIQALTPIEDFNEFFGLQIQDEDFDTIGGMVLKAFGHLPQTGEKTRVAGMGFEVLQADGRRIHLLRICLDDVEEASGD